MFSVNEDFHKPRDPPTKVRKRKTLGQCGSQCLIVGTIPDKDSESTN